LDGLRLTGFFLERSVLTDWRSHILAARERLVERLKRAAA
jgi:DNA repair protein RecO (recombination protein O)